MKIIFTDIDNTLYKQGENLIHQKTIESIKLAQAKGIEVIIATGNAYFPGENVANVAERLNIRYVIASNGATIFDRKENKFILSEKIPASIANEINDHLVALEEHAQWWDEQWIYVNAYGPENNQAQAAILTPSSKLGRADRIDKDIYKIESYMHGKPNEKAALAKWLKRYDEYEIVVMREHIEITHKGVSKGSAVQFMMDKLNVSSEDTMSMGDSSNDLSMFAVTGTSYAMGNSMPSILEAANGAHVARAENGGAGEAINHWLELKNVL